MARLDAVLVLDAAKRQAVQAQAAIVRHGEFFLGGGTAVALHLGNRLSRDLDWFTPLKFDGASLAKVLASSKPEPSKIEQSGPDTVRAYYDQPGSGTSLETSFLRYSQVSASPSIKEVAGVRIPVADLVTLAAMKSGAILNRGAKRDFLDVHAITHSPNWSMDRFVRVAEEKLRIAPPHLCRALTYFVDADRDPDPAGLQVTWSQVKQDVVRAVRALEQNRGPDRGR
jgi:hypothetical protein